MYSDFLWEYPLYPHGQSNTPWVGAGIKNGAFRNLNGILFHADAEFVLNEHITCNRNIIKCESISPGNDPKIFWVCHYFMYRHYIYGKFSRSTSYNSLYPVKSAIIDVTQCQSASTRGVGCWLTDSTASSSCKLCNIPSKLRIIISRLYSLSEVVIHLYRYPGRYYVQATRPSVTSISRVFVFIYVRLFFLPVAIDVRRRQCCIMDYITLCQSTRTSFPVFLYQL
jgi:hypothetical protein